MRMGTSYGLIEVSGVVAAIDSLDAMCKAAEVSLVTWERKLGGRLVTLIVEGDVADCKAAVEAASAICAANRHILASSGVIAAPAEETRRLVALSRKRIAPEEPETPKTETKKTETKKTEHKKSDQKQKPKKK